MCVDRGRRRWAAVDEIIFVSSGLFLLVNVGNPVIKTSSCVEQQLYYFDSVVFVSCGSKSQTKAGRNQDQLQIYGCTEKWKEFDQSRTAEYGFSFD